MTYQPVLPITGLAGWSFLSRTLETQTKAFAKSPEISRDTEYFQKNIANARTAADLVSDRRLLRVALGAFGLGDDLNSKAFVQKILEGGTQDSDALAMKLSDERYRNFSKAFGYGNPGGAVTGNQTWANDIVAKFRTQQFEVAIGNQDQSMRLALASKRTMADIATGPGNDQTRWLKVMGHPPLRQVFETALGLPSSFAQADLDLQVAEFSYRAKRQLGIEDLSELVDPAVQKKVVERFLLRDQIQANAVQSSASIALTLLQSAPRWF